MIGVITILSALFCAALAIMFPASLSGERDRDLRLTGFIISAGIAVASGVLLYHGVTMP